MHPMIDVLAVFATLLLTGVELSVAGFVHPVLYKLDDASHAATAKLLARLLGKVMPSWYAAALLLVVASTFTRAVGTGSWWACLAAAVLLAATVPFSLICLVPINRRVAEWDLAALPANWQADRRQWDRYHILRMGILVLASLLILAAAVMRPPTA